MTNTIGIKDDYCDICGKQLTKMTNDAGFRHEVGLMLDVTGGFEEAEFTALFGKSKVIACYCCFAKGIGFKVVNQEK